MNGHTPGPWVVQGDAIRVIGADHCPVADIRGWGHLTGTGHGARNLSAQIAIEIQQANARLIAAAPDMLAALQLLRGFAWSVDDSEHGKEIKRRAEAAIVKATYQV